MMLSTASYHVFPSNCATLTRKLGSDVFFICGFASASVLWFLGISTVISLFSARFNNRILNIINKVCGAVIIFYGCKLAWSFLKLMGWVG